MAIFKKSKAKEVVVEKALRTTGSLIAPRALSDISSIIVRPRITEKSAGGNESGVYVFDVRVDSNATLVKEAIVKLYKVTPRKINLVMVPTKNVIVRGRRGTKGGGKKAYVYLKKGDKIEIA